MEVHNTQLADARDILRDWMQTVTQSDKVFDVTELDAKLSRLHELLVKQPQELPVISRQDLEKAVMRVVAGNIFDAGMVIRVTLHGDYRSVGETDMHLSLTDDFIDDSTCADEIEWDVYYASGDHYSGVLLVLGNEGYNVISNHGSKMSRFMPSDAEMDRFEALAGIAT